VRWRLRVLLLGIAAQSWHDQLFEIAPENFVNNEEDLDEQITPPPL
jgi:hypothetical protein